MALLPLWLSLLALLAATAVCGVRVLALVRARRASGRSAEALMAEIAWVASAAQRWAVTPAVLGGGADRSDFAGIGLGDLGLMPDPRRPYLHRLEHGTARLLPVPSCAALDALSARFGGEEGRGGLLVLGWETGLAHAVAVLVLGPLAAVPLAQVPWTWVRALMQPPAPEAAPVPRTATPPRAPRTAPPRHAQPGDWDARRWMRLRSDAVPRAPARGFPPAGYAGAMTRGSPRGSPRESPRYQKEAL